MLYTWHGGAVALQIVSQEGLEVLEEEVLRLLQGIDIDGSNTLDYREFLAATMDRNVFIREENMRCG
jgi:Ca2+-binding EF-hand superfamily protein